MTTKAAIKEQLTNTDRAVSPVIGVILMVAITVILAAVIGTFVLDIGQDAGQTAPQASLQVSTTASSDQVTVEHRGGDGLTAADSRVRVSDGSTTITFDSSNETDALTVGDDFTVDTNASTLSGWSGFSSGGNSFQFSSGTQITVTVIDIESQRVIFETTVTA